MLENILADDRMLECCTQLQKCDRRMLTNRTYCYAEVLQETCNISAADLMALKTLLYNAKYWQVVDVTCTLSESHCYVSLYTRTVEMGFKILLFRVVFYKQKNKNKTSKVQIFGF